MMLSLGWLSQFPPMGLGHRNMIVSRGRTYVDKGLIAIAVGHVGNLIKAGDGVPDMGGIRQWFLARVRERVDAVWQVAARRQFPMFSVR